MSIDLQLETMTVSEKLEAMELIWADLSQTPSEVKSPDWHGDVLDARRPSGEEKFQDWGEAKQELRDELNEDSNS